ncbi:hypothetical protein ACYBUH_25290 [Klebsiella pneumoniae]
MNDKVITLAPDSPLNKMLDLIANVASRKIPGVSVVLELRQAYAKIREEIHQDRMLDFALGLRDLGIDKDNFDLSSECFSAIVTKLLLDDEKRKTEFYIKLTIELARSDLDPDLKIYYINTLSELTGADIDFARKLYIRQTVPLRGYTSLEDAELALTSSKQGITLKSLHKLINHGLLDENRSGDIRAKPLYNMTDELKTLISYLFHPDDLVPSAIGDNQKEAFDVIIIDHYKSLDNLYITQIRDTLTNKQISVGIVQHNDDYRLQKTAKLYIYNNAMTHYSGSRSKEYIQVFVLFDPASDTLKLSHSGERSFKIEKENYFGAIRNSADARKALLNTLSSVTDYVVGYLKKPEHP